MLGTIPTHCGVATYPPGATFGPRTLQDYEFVWVIEGDVQYQRGDTVIDAPPDSMILCRPDSIDFFQWDRRRRTRHAFIHFQIEGWSEETPSEWPVVLPLPKEDIIRPLFRHFLTWSERESESDRRRTVAHILSAFLSGTISLGLIGRKEWPEAVEVACDFLFRAINADPARPLSLAQLADAASVTPEHLCRLFKSSIGYSPTQTVRLARMDYAANLLTRTNYSSAEISALLGFSNPYHFSRLFRQTFGRPAPDMRRDVAAGLPPPASLVVQNVRAIEPDI